MNPSGLPLSANIRYPRLTYQSTYSLDDSTSACHDDVERRPYVPELRRIWRRSSSAPSMSTCGGASWPESCSRPSRGASSCMNLATLTVLLTPRSGGGRTSWRRCRCHSSGLQPHQAYTSCLYDASAVRTVLHVHVGTSARLFGLAPRVRHCQRRKIGLPEHNETNTDYVLQYIRAGTLYEPLRHPAARHDLLTARLPNSSLTAATPIIRRRRVVSFIDDFRGFTSRGVVIEKRPAQWRRLSVRQRPRTQIVGRIARTSCLSGGTTPPGGSAATVDLGSGRRQAEGVSAMTSRRRRRQDDLYGGTATTFRVRAYVDRQDSSTTSNPARQSISLRRIEPRREDQGTSLTPTPTERKYDFSLTVAASVKISDIIFALNAPIPESN